MRPFIGVIGAVSALVLALIPGEAGAVHDEIGLYRCLDCHAALPLKRGPLSFVSGTRRVCLRCHREGHLGGGEGHPIQGRPEGSIPPDMPLEGNGTISCITCHAFHPEGSPEKDGRPTFLRRATPMELCRACHPNLERLIERR